MAREPCRAIPGGRRPVLGAMQRSAAATVRGRPCATCRPMAARSISVSPHGGNFGWTHPFRAPATPQRRIARRQTAKRAVRWNNPGDIFRTSPRLSTRKGDSAYLSPPRGQRQPGATHRVGPRPSALSRNGNPQLSTGRGGAYYYDYVFIKTTKKKTGQQGCGPPGRAEPACTRRDADQGRRRWGATADARTGPLRGAGRRLSKARVGGGRHRAEKRLAGLWCVLAGRRAGCRQPRPAAPCFQPPGACGAEFSARECGRAESLPAPLRAADG